MCGHVAALESVALHRNRRLATLGTVARTATSKGPDEHRPTAKVMCIYRIFDAFRKP
jgi:hypothetical protein